MQKVVFEATSRMVLLQEIWKLHNDEKFTMFSARHAFSPVTASWSLVVDGVALQ